MLKLNFENVKIDEKEIMKYKSQIENIHKDLHRRANDEEDFVGWIELPTNYNKEEFERIKKAAEKIRKESDILVVIGIGGSYLGARAVIDALTSSFVNLQTEDKRKYPMILYAGNNLSPNYINELIEIIGDKDQYNKDIALFESLIDKCDNREIIINPETAGTIAIILSLLSIGSIGVLITRKTKKSN